ncbi:MAG: RNA polymerase sigma factor [Myxococcales bacterium]|nr:RNA polymerase sigma factor [Myxococcales bacterium]
MEACSIPSTEFFLPSPTFVESSPDFSQIFSEHAPYVWRVLRRMGIREADVEDVLQEVFLRVHRRLPHFEGRSSLRTWIYGFCIRTASEHRRRAHIRREVLAEDQDHLPLSAVAPEHERALSQRDARRELDALLGTLDEEKRAVFVLFEIEQLPMAEVAIAIERPLQTAYSRYYAARDQLKAEARRMRLRGQR